MPVKQELERFFDYLTDVSFNKGTRAMQLSDLEKVTPAILENFVEYSSHITADSLTRRWSNASMKRRFCALNSFLDYYFMCDFISFNTVKELSIPIHRTNQSRHIHKLLKVYGIPGHEIPLQIIYLFRSHGMHVDTKSGDTVLCESLSIAL